jgi:hypothetical protein
VSTILIRNGSRYFKVKVNPSPVLSGVSPASGIKYVVKKNQEWQEWQVRAYVNGKYDEGKTYFAGDKEDAIQTFNHFIQGHDVGRKNPEGTNLITLANHIAHVRDLRDAQKRDSDDYSKLNEILKSLEAQYRQLRRGRLASAIRIGRRKNPLLKSPYMKHVGANVSYLMKHPEELTAKTKEGKRKQAIAIALSVMQRAQKTQKNPQVDFPTIKKRILSEAREGIVQDALIHAAKKKFRIGDGHDKQILIILGTMTSKASQHYFDLRKSLIDPLPDMGARK